jgi:hypothetical protein
MVPVPQVREHPLNAVQLPITQSTAHVCVLQVRTSLKCGQSLPFSDIGRVSARVRV